VFIVSLVACKSRQAREFNDEIVHKYASLLPEVNAAEGKIMQYINNGNYDSVVVVAEKMEQLADDKIIEVQNLSLPDVNGAATFRNSFVTFFEYIKSIYSNYKSYGQANPGKDREAASKIVLAILRNKDTVVNSMQKIQKAFAESNGFKIEQNVGASDK